MVPIVQLFWQIRGNLSSQYDVSGGPCGDGAAIEVHLA